MRVRILGSAAGGGFPQWNCNCSNCRRIRRGEIRATPRTQSSVAVSSNGTDWVLFNASPDIRAQLEAFPAMQPARRVRDTAICAVVLIDAQVDHTAGLLGLREKDSPLEVYCTNGVCNELTTSYPLFTVLKHFCGIAVHPIPLDDGASFNIRKIETLRFTAIALKSEAPPFSAHRHQTRRGDTIGVCVEDLTSSKRLFYAPGLGQIEPHVMQTMKNADCLLVDGTFWSDDELSCEGISEKRASDMGHLQLAGENGIISVLNTLPHSRKILTHINNTNPILDEDSPQRAELANAGIEVAYDGMDITL